MLPTLAEGDVVLADLRAATKRPDRGDMVVFAHGAKINSIKRVIGLPGDHVVFRDQTLILNFDPVTAPAGEDTRLTTRQAQYDVSLRTEILPHTDPYQVALAQHPAPLLASAPATVVPPGSLYVVGDNRDASFDSRSARFGTVRIDDVVGRIVYRLRPNAAWLVPLESVPGLAPE